MRARGDQSAKLRRLAELASSPTEQTSYALSLVETERMIDVVLAALQVITENPSAAARPVLLRKYAYLDADGIKRDPGGYVRTQILRALRRVARADDLPLLERAATTYEFMPPARSEVASEIRSNAVVAMNELDSELASFHCVRLLADSYTSRMSGEPALSAARILASQLQVLPLYQYVVSPTPGVPEVVSEALRNLTAIPESLLKPIVDKYRETDDGVELVGLFDLILTHKQGSSFNAFVVEFVRETSLLDVHRYVLAAIVANRKTDLLASVLQIAREETDRRKIENLIDALSLMRADRTVETALNDLRRRLN